MLKYISCWALLTLLQLKSVLAQDSSQLQDPNHFYSVDKQTPLTLTEVDLSIQQALSLNGSGIASISFTPQSDIITISSFKCEVIEANWCVLPRYNTKSKIVIVCAGGEACHFDVRLLSGSENLKFDADGDTFIQLALPANSTEFTFTLNMDKFINQPSKEKILNKIRFSAEPRQQGFLTNLRKTIGNSLGMVIKKKNPDGTTTKIKSEPVQLWGTLMATVPQTDSDYCASKGCAYEISINSTSFRHLVFVAKSISSPSEQNLSVYDNYPSMFFVGDQTYKGVDNRYILNIPESGDLIFDLEPMEGNPDIYVSIDGELDFDISKYKYKSDRDLSESLIINKGLFDSILGPRKVYCVVISQEPSTYLLSAQYRSASLAREATSIRLNKFYSGALRENELMNFILDLNTEVSQTISAYISLKATGGNPDLYIKDCENETQCMFSLEEIKEKVERLKRSRKDKNSSVELGADYFSFSEQKGNDDDLFFSINTVPFGAIRFKDKTGEDVPKFPNKNKISNYNRICIGVVGHSNTYQNLSEYSLLVSGRYAHNVLNEYRTEFVFMSSKDERYFVYNPRSIPSQALGIKLQFEVSSGDANIYFSSIAKYPTESNYDNKIFVDNDQMRAESTSKELEIPKSKLNSQGVYVGILAIKQSFIKIYLSYWLPKPKKGEFIDFIPDVPIYRSLEMDSDFLFEDEYDAYRLEFYTGNDTTQDVYIRMSQYSSGTGLRMSAGQAKSGLKPSDCSITSDTELLIIPYNTLKKMKTDSGKVEIIIFVTESQLRSKNHLHSHHIEYEIVLVGQTSDREIRVSGVPIETSTFNTSPNHHYHDFMIVKDEGYVFAHIETLLDQEVSLKLSFSKDSQTDLRGDGELLGADQYSQYYTKMHQGTIETRIFKKKDIKKYCEIPTMDSDGENRLLEKDGQMQPSLLPSYAQLKCTMYLTVTPVNYNQASSIPYRLWIVKDSDMMRIVRGERYILPAPGTSNVELEVSISTLPTGAVITVTPDRYDLEVKAWIITMERGTTIERYSTNLYRSKGPWTRVISIPVEDIDKGELGAKDADSFIRISIANANSGDVNIINNTFDTKSRITVMVSRDLSALTLGEETNGLVYNGRLV